MRTCGATRRSPDRQHRHPDAGIDERASADVVGGLDDIARRETRRGKSLACTSWTGEPVKSLATNSSSRKSASRCGDSVGERMQRGTTMTKGSRRSGHPTEAGRESSQGLRSGHRYQVGSAANRRASLSTSSTIISGNSARRVRTIRHQGQPRRREMADRQVPGLCPRAGRAPTRPSDSGCATHHRRRSPPACPPGLAARHAGALEQDQPGLPPSRHNSLADRRRRQPELVGSRLHRPGGHDGTEGAQALGIEHTTIFKHR